MLTLKKVKELVEAPVHTKRVPSPKVLLEEGRIFLRKEFEHGSHLTLYHNGYVWFSAGKRNTVFHIHDCRGDYAYGASKGKGEVIKEEYFENCEWHIRALFEGEQRVEESQLKCEGVGQTKVSVSYHAVAEDWGEMADSEINVLDKYIEKEALHAMMAVLTKKQRNLMLIVQNQVWNRVTINRNSKKNTRYYIDEFHLLLKEEQTAAYSVEIWKRFRKWGGIPTGITQNIKDLLASREIENIFENSDFIYMLNQASGDRQILAKQLNISPFQLSYVTNSNEGEGLLFYGNTIIPFKDKFDTSLKLYSLMTTKPNEMGKYKEKKEA